MKPRLVCLLLHDVYRRKPAESGFIGSGADRYKLPLARFDRLLDDLAAHWPDAPLLATRWPPLSSHGFLVTVDDGGISYTTLVADRLEARGWHGHAFICTDCVGRRGFLGPRDLRDLDQRGHVIGTHSATHPARFSACSWPRMVDEWRRSRQILEDWLGHEVRTGSVPGGYFVSRVAEAASAAGLDALFTSEPVLTPRFVGAIATIGRLTVRPGRSPATVAAMAAGRREAVFREWVAWNAKKAAKALLGEAYPRLAASVPQRALAPSCVDSKEDL